MQYKAFISYSHTADNKIAPAIQSALHRFAKPWYRLRALKIYRDKTSQSLTASLWPAIKNAMEESEYFIFLASPEASNSNWVRQEIEYWINNRSPKNILIVVTEGIIEWDKLKKDFDWNKTSALPENLKGVFENEPLWLDLQWAKKVEHLSLKHHRFKEGIAKLASTLHNLPLDEISGEDVRQHRNTLKITWSAIVTLLLLTVMSIFFAIRAENKRKDAERQSYISISQSLAAYAPREQEQGRKDELAALLALQAYKYNKRYKSERTDYVDEALRQVLKKPFFNIQLTGGNEKPRLTSASFSKESNYLAVGGYDMRIRIWDLVNKTDTPLIINQPHGIIQSLEFSHNRNILSAGTENGHVIIWRYNDECSFDSMKVLNGHGDRRVTSIKFNKDGNLMASAGFDGKIRIWNFDNIDSFPIILSNQGINKPIKSLAFHSGLKNIIVAGGDDKILRFWNIYEPDKPFSEVKIAEDAITSIAFSDNEQWIAVGTDCSFKMGSIKDLIQGEAESFNLLGNRTGGDIYLWDIKKKNVKLKILKGHEDAVTSLSFSPDCRVLASAGNGDQTIRIWNLDSLEKPPEIIRGNESLVSRITFSNDSRYLASVYNNESVIRIWSIEQSAGAPKVLTGHKLSVRALEFDHFENYLFSGGREDGTVRIWNINQLQKRPITFYNEGTTESISLNPRDKVFATGYGAEMLEFENQIIIRSYKNTNDTVRILSGHKSAVKFLGYDAEGKLLVSAGEFDKEIWIWNINDTLKNEPMKVFSSLGANVKSLALGKKKQILAWGGDDGVIRVINNFVTDPDSIVFNAHESSVNSLLFAKNDEILLSGGSDGKILIWNLNSKKYEPVIIEKYEGKIFDIALDSAESMLASSGSEGYVQIHNLKNIDADALIFDGLKGNIFSVAFSHDSKWIAVGGSNGQVKVWPLTNVLAELVCQKVWRNLTHDEWNRFIGQNIPYECTCSNLPSGEIESHTKK